MKRDWTCKNKPAEELQKDQPAWNGGINYKEDSKCRMAFCHLNPTVYVELHLREPTSETLVLINKYCCWTKNVQPMEIHYLESCESAL